MAGNIQRDLVNGTRARSYPIGQYPDQTIGARAWLVGLQEQNNFQSTFTLRHQNRYYTVVHEQRPYARAEGFGVHSDSSRVTRAKREKPHLCSGEPWRALWRGRGNFSGDSSSHRMKISLRRGIGFNSCQNAYISRAFLLNGLREMSC